MKLKQLKYGVVAIAAALAINSPVIYAQDDTPKAKSLDELLQMVRQGKIRESEDHRKREAEFRQNRANQRNALNEAKQVKEREEKRSAELEATFERQKREVTAEKARLQARLGNLNELFGHLTSTAGDTRQQLESSLISAQPGFDGRAVFLDGLIEKMNSATQLPSIAEIENLWTAMHEEITESAKIVKFSATVKKANGDTATETVTRIGNYNMVSETGNYLYRNENSEIVELPRQPSGFNANAAALTAAASGFVRVGIDPTGSKGGDFLRKIINKKTVIEQWHEGGTVGYIISGVGAAAMLLALLRFLMLIGTRGKVKAQVRAKKANPNNPLGRVLKVAEDNPNCDGETLELKLEEAILKERPSIEAGLGILKIVYMVAPLMGLLGTVTGMIQTFQAITIYGAGDPSTMAAGISTALVTTVLGLVVAIPTMLVHTLLSGFSKTILQVLDEQSAGIIAQNAGK